MRLQEQPPLHLGYCLNIHPGETWAENLAAIREKALAVRDKVAPGKRFALGLRLSRRAAADLTRPRAMAEFRELLAEEDLYVRTINGFPYGRFHGAAVKQQVYRPDWRTAERRDYTIALADVLAQLLPVGDAGDISTVPGSYKAWIRSDEDVVAMAAMVAETALHLSEIHDRTGREITLALEPEPDCYIESTAETVAFFDGPLARFGAGHLRDHRGLSAVEAERITRRYLGVCFDTAHAAVQFERPAEGLARLRAGGIGVPRIQLSAALCARPTAETCRRLRDFCDPVYLHQVKARSADGTVHARGDLPAALDAVGETTHREQWRVHFHVPLFFDRFEGLRSTRSLLPGGFAEMLADGRTRNLEIETYTFDVLLDALRPPDVTDCIAAEYRWVMENLLGPH